MPQIATLTAPDKGELNRALRREKQAAQTQKRREHLENRDELLQSIPPLPKYQPIEIAHREAVSHVFSDAPYPVFSLI